MEPFPKLLSDIRACTLCAEHLPHGPRPVLQVNPAARILIAAQTPGRKVHNTGIPFNDASGDRLRVWLGISPELFYDPTHVAILPMGFCYPGTGKSGDLPPRAECARTWRARVLSCLTNIQLTLIIGQYALAYHVPNAGMSLTEMVQDWQGQWPHTLILPHPSPRNNPWLKKNPWFEDSHLSLLRTRVAEVLAYYD